jgi:hypothetical protein
VSFDPVTRTPLWIVTELMQHSVYSLVHELRVELTLAEIVDVSVGVASGLQVRPPPTPVSGSGCCLGRGQRCYGCFFLGGGGHCFRGRIAL